MVGVVALSLLAYGIIVLAICKDESDAGKRWVRQMERMPRRVAWDSWWVKHDGYVPMRR